MTKKSFKKFLLASSCAVTTLCSSAPLTYAMPPPSFVIFTSLGNIGASGTNLSNYSNQNPSPTFISGSAIQYSDDNIAINVDISTTTIQAIDVNGKSGTALRVNMNTTMPSPQLLLGSVYDRTAAPRRGRQPRSSILLMVIPSNIPALIIQTPSLHQMTG